MSALSFCLPEASVAGDSVLTFFLNRENVVRRLWIGGGELCIVGDEGGLDRGSASENKAGNSPGLDGCGVELSRAMVCVLTGDSGGGFGAASTSVLSGVHSTRLRLVGGSSGKRGRFVCRE